MPPCTCHPAGTSIENAPSAVSVYCTHFSSGWAAELCCEGKPDFAVPAWPVQPTSTAATIGITRLRSSIAWCPRSDLAVGGARRSGAPEDHGNAAGRCEHLQVVMADAAHEGVVLGRAARIARTHVRDVRFPSREPESALLFCCARRVQVPFVRNDIGRAEQVGDVAACVATLKLGRVACDIGRRTRKSVSPVVEIRT